MRAVRRLQLFLRSTIKQVRDNKLLSGVGRLLGCVKEKLNIVGTSVMLSAETADITLWAEFT